MMNDFAKKWVAALRSGKYKQGTGKLNKDGNYCCLGVACQLYEAENPGKLVVEEEDTVFFYDDNYLSLPEKVKDAMGIKHLQDEFETPVEFGDQKYYHLCLLNDAGMSFSEIADVIESRQGEIFYE